MVGWNSSMPDDEVTPIMHPVRMELAPHARLGRRMAASTAIFVLLTFHCSMIAVGVLNMNANCSEMLWMFLVIYGGVGLLFVYLLFREWLYYARLASLPSLFNLILLIIFYSCLTTAGGFLAYYTAITQDSCGTSAPLLYRWCQAAVLFFAILTILALIIPFVRGMARLLCAPCALCLISCVETVGVDIEMEAGAIAAAGDGFAGEGGGAGGFAASGVGGGKGSGGKGAGAGKFGSTRDRNNAAAVTISFALCSPCMCILMPIYYILIRPIGNLLWACCGPVGSVLMSLLQMCGLLSLDGEALSLKNPCADGGPCCGPNSPFSLPGLSRACAQIALAPGCIVPGRSLIALFVNTAALLWFFVYLGWVLYDNWEIRCTVYAVDGNVPFASNPLTWLLNGAPSPIHWLLLTFAVAGTVIVLISFFGDMFSGPKPPPRSFYEATLWRGKRQVKVISYVLLLMIFIGWGISLTYYAFANDGCSTQGTDPSLTSLYNVAYLLVLLFVVIVGLIAVLGCCVILDCFISGRVRLVMLLGQPEPSLPPPPEQYANAHTGDERLVPGVPPRDMSQYGSGGATAGSAFLIGASESPASRLCTASDQQPGAVWASPGAKLPTVKR